MAVLTQGAVLFFVLGVVGTWLFAAVDACRTAQLMRAGLSPDAEDDVIARRLYGNPFAWGTTLIIIGTLFLLHTLLRVTLPIKELLPVALVALGRTCYLITLGAVSRRIALCGLIRGVRHRRLSLTGRLIPRLFALVKPRSSRGATLLRCHSNGDPELGNR